MYLTTIKKFSKRDKNGKYRYFKECVCICGNSITTRIDSTAKSCGCKKNYKQRGSVRKRNDNEIFFKEYMSKIVYKTSKYNDGDISFNKFLELSQKNCYYCDSPPSNKAHIGRKKDGTLRKRVRKGKDGVDYFIHSWGSQVGDGAIFTFNGLDRLDSNKKHTLDNVVTCCKMCNFMKINYSLEVFLNQIKRIYECRIKQN